MLTQTCGSQAWRAGARPMDDDEKEFSGLIEEEE